MTLIVEDGTGLPTAESYVSVDDATIYHEDRGNAAWAAGSHPAQEAALRRATEFIDAAFQRRWTGLIAVSGQSLAWPRTRARDASGVLQPENAVPRAVKRATCEAALRELQDPGGLQPDIYPGERVTSETVGPLSVDYSDQGSPTDVLPSVTIVNRLLAPLLRSTAGALVLRA